MRSRGHFAVARLEAVHWDAETSFEPQSWFQRVACTVIHYLGRQICLQRHLIITTHYFNTTCAMMDSVPLSFFLPVQWPLRSRSFTRVVSKHTCAFTYSTLWKLVDVATSGGVGDAQTVIGGAGNAVVFCKKINPHTRKWSIWLRRDTADHEAVSVKHQAWQKFSFEQIWRH